MKKDAIAEAVEIWRKSGRVFLITANVDGIPHLTIATKFSMDSINSASIAGWFCPQTVANLEENPNMGVAVWDEESDKGYQLLGKKESLRETAFLDGYDAGLEKKPPLPQVERNVVIRVEKILGFKKAPHSDLDVRGDHD